MTAEWWRDGERVKQDGTYSASYSANGYRIDWAITPDAPGAWEVRVYNSLGQLVARRAFAVS